MLHTLGDVFKGCKEILPGIFVGANMDDVVEYVDSGGEVEGRMRFFLGYSGWQSNQLESELLGKSWAWSGMNRRQLCSKGLATPIGDGR
jgi:putative transcriptional regulator